THFLENREMRRHPPGLDESLVRVAESNKVVRYVRLQQLQNTLRAFHGIERERGVALVRQDRIRAQDASYYGKMGHALIRQARIESIDQTVHDKKKIGKPLFQSGVGLGHKVLSPE